MVGGAFYAPPRPRLSLQTPASDRVNLVGGGFWYELIKAKPELSKMGLSNQPAFEFGDFMTRYW